MAKDIFGNKITTDIYGNPLKSKPKRQSVAQSTKRAIEIKQRGKCALCHRPLIGSKHFDHIRPVHRGGKSTTDNLRAICASCHDRRHILEKAAKMDKKKRNEGIKPKGQTWVNPITGRTERISPFRF